MSEMLVTFILASALLSLAPGPDNLFVLTMSAVHGPRPGIMVTLGLCTGLVLHTLAAAIGIAAIFQTYDWAYQVLKLVGAGYLLYLAWVALNTAASEKSFAETPGVSLPKLYRRGFIMNITNPKVSIFFLAFLPQFASAEQGAMMPQMLLLGAIFIMVAMVVFSSLALFAGVIGKQIRESTNLQNILHRLAAMVFIGLASKLIFEEML